MITYHYISFFVGTFIAYEVNFDFKLLNHMNIINYLVIRFLIHRLGISTLLKLDVDVNLIFNDANYI